MLEALRSLTGPHCAQFLVCVCRDSGAPIIRLRLPMQDTYVISHPDLYHAILGDRTHDKPALLKAIESLVNGRPTLFTASTASASRQTNRKRVAPAFAPTHLAAKVPPFQSALEPLSAILDGHAAEGTPVEINDLLLWLTLDFISASAFDYDLHALTGGDDSEGRRFVRELDVGLDEFVGKQMFMPWRRFMFWNPEVQRARQAVDWLVGLATRIIHQYRKSHTPKDISTGSSLLAHLLRNDNYPDDGARAADVIVFLVGGHDTTANTLAWALYDLARTPEVQERLLKEVDALYAFNAHPSLSELTAAPLLNRCLRESMRLWPVALAADRVLSRDIEFDGMVVPRGSWVLFPFQAAFRPTWLPDTDEYRPDRWINPDPRLEATTMPFSAGVRNCVGQNLAMLELRVALAAIVRRFAFRVVQEPEPFGCFTMRPKGLRLAFERRKECDSATGVV